jgi:hypothetical protein
METAKVIAQGLGNRRINFKSGSPFHYMGGQAISGSGEAFEEATDKLAAAISNTVATIREEVLPKIRTATDSIKEIAVKRLGDERDNLIPDIVKFGIPEAIARQIEDGTITKRDVNGIPNRRVVLPTNLDINKIIKETPNLSGDVVEYLNSIPEGRATAVYKEIFTEPGKADVYKIANTRLMTPETTQDVYIANILSKILINEIPEGTVGELVDYRVVIDSINAITSRSILSLYNEFNNSYNKNLLILGRTDKTVIVNEAVYNDFIASNGDVDALLGLWSKGTAQVTKELATTQGETHAQAWNAYVSLKLKEVETRNHQAYKAIYYNYFTSSEFEYDEEFASDAPIAKLTKYLNATLRDPIDIERVVKHIIGSIFYSKLGVSGFLQLLEDEKHKGHKIEEAVTLAINEFTIQTVLSFVEVEG